MRVTAEIEIVWHAHKVDGGWIPVFTVTGKRHGTVLGRVMDKDEALALAEREARFEATRFIGDWDVTLRQGAPDETASR